MAHYGLDNRTQTRWGVLLNGKLLDRLPFQLTWGDPQDLALGRVYEHRTERAVQDKDWLRECHQDGFDDLHRFSSL